MAFFFRSRLVDETVGIGSRDSPIPVSDREAPSCRPKGTSAPEKDVFELVDYTQKTDFMGSALKLDLDSLSQAPLTALLFE